MPLRRKLMTRLHNDLYSRRGRLEPGGPLAPSSKLSHGRAVSPSQWLDLHNGGAPHVDGTVASRFQEFWARPMVGGSVCTELRGSSSRSICGRDAGADACNVGASHIAARRIDLTQVRGGRHTLRANAVLHVPLHGSTRCRQLRRGTCGMHVT